MNCFTSSHRLSSFLVTCFYFGFAPVKKFVNKLRGKEFEHDSFVTHSLFFLRYHKVFRGKFLVNDIVLLNHFQNGERDDFEIKKKRLAFEIFFVERRFIVAADAGAAVDLRPAGNAGDEFVDA